ncbi:MBL fold metallo-hydrolase [Aquisalinus flavus]|uniref:Phosphoribosyl 1,2-cyclic phosphodiesterase n=1 Tax=Aquisalinus flavus TaxID=1526572 RepID=A0A8J2V6D7_9PROT|nr:MBL fold metallo-hydrolase [Aquisalinus flavus]MBD0427743.1 MBL fold metallo-hydrolase [Aquisalinus flavus]UNE47518.1 MBL fold metallo-hydrolase [Aquisalinus flavus]GGD03471.1 phosphoribosyl 1,2-cyclic phosphodiesterase [Aquisalinus flavus]
MTLRAIILGCGSSGGIPRPGGPGGKGQWGQLDPSEPKNRRMRCSILVQKEHPEAGWSEPEMLTTVLVDTSPDLARQLLMAQAARLDAVFFTHDHADQSHGIDDLRAMALSMRQRVPTYIDQSLSPEIVDRFRYCFHQKPGSSYPPILELIDMPACGERAIVNGPSGSIAVVPFLQHHGRIDSLGFLFGEHDLDLSNLDGRGIAYSSDTNALPDETFELLDRVGLWIVDALQRKPHPSHSHLEQSLDWLARVKARRGVLTNMHLDMDYGALCNELPEHVEPAYDGMLLTLQE